MEYDHIVITDMVEELLNTLQPDAEAIASRLKREVCGDFSPYSDGEEMLAEHEDLVRKGEEYLIRFNA